MADQSTECARHRVHNRGCNISDQMELGHTTTRPNFRTEGFPRSVCEESSLGNLSGQGNMGGGEKKSRATGSDKLDGRKMCSEILQRGAGLHG